ncbi:hypothetical protein EUX98_g9229 [Antrodiella citrinella]|uniref:DUF6589 domain-containing protein n=1 Tax=Antrodiella citrinella TaxID=2447956 RepID=A0A4S4LWG1_9APHY|nr:hypothetical protein EUX98_g9229 [Antrodiella citrinella]
MIYQNKLGRPPAHHPERAQMFSSDEESSDLLYAQPAISTWAAELVAGRLIHESNKLIHEKSGLRVRASRKAIPKDAIPVATQVTVPTAPGDSLPVQPPVVSEPDTLDSASTDAAQADEEVDEEGDDPDDDERSIAVSMIGDGDLVDNEDQGMGVENDAGGQPQWNPEVPIGGTLNDGFGDEWEDVGELAQTEAAASTTSTRHTPEPQPCRKKLQASDPTVDWDLISGFSLEKLMEKYTKVAPLTVWLLFRAIRPHEPRKQGKRQNRPKWIHLKQMAAAKRAQFKNENSVRKKKREVVLDNLQAWAARRDQRIGNENKMILGTGATAVELEDLLPDALDFDAWQAKHKEGMKERESFTIEDLVDDIDVEHLKQVGVLHWLDALVFYVPALEEYRSELTKAFDFEVQKHQINPNRHSKVQPLGTNSANETTTKGMRDALFDFLEQTGITEETLKEHREVQFVSGDGKSFENIGKTKQYLSSQEGDFKSLNFVYEILELWHTKWTDLGRNTHGKWGKGAETTDPSTLGFIAKTINSPAPSDTKKPDFYPNARLMEVTVQAHMLHCWETHLNTSDLGPHFASLLVTNTLPTLTELRTIAEVLYMRYSTTTAYNLALQDQAQFKDHPCVAPKAPNLNHPAATRAVSPPSPSSEPMDIEPDRVPAESKLDLMDVDTGPGPERVEAIPNPAVLPEATATSASTSESTPSSFKGDWPLANSIILMRDGIWFLEVCRAVALGDVGRVWEVLKVWILTFSGGGNTNYVSYLLDMYCKITMETPEPMRLAVFNNWLVNLQGKPGHFLELDLMQEHFNFWLEELAQHKGKEFDEEWYRDVLSMHVYHFLRLKEEMEASVHLSPRRKTHTEPHLQNEYRETLRVFREFNLHCHHEGRDLGHHSLDDFSRGIANLGRTSKVADVIANSLRARDNVEKEITATPRAMAADPRTYMCTPMYYRNGRVLGPPDIDIDDA